MAEVNWAEAFEIGGIGFGLVFLVLVILAVVIWITGLWLKRHGDEEEEKTEGEGG